MMRVARFGMKGLFALGLLLIGAQGVACGGAAVTEKDPELTADPPEGKSPEGTKATSGTEFQRGKAYVENEKFAEAKGHLKKAIELDPTNAQAMLYLAAANEGLGDLPGAEAAYKDALKADPKFVVAAQNLAALYLQEPARPDEAISLLNETLAKVPGDVRLLQNLAYAYTLKKDVDNASKQYDALLSKKGGDTPQNRLAYASLLLEAKLRDKAAEQLKKVLTATDEDATKLSTVGRLLANAGAFGDCVNAFTRAIAVKADDPALFMRRGICRRELKDEAGARKDFEAALKLDPNLVAGHFQLGLSWAAEKNVANAKAAFTKASELGKDSEVGKAARQKLSELPKK